MKPRLAVHKFSSCDGCQLALLNLGEVLLEFAQQFEIVHFAEAGVVDERCLADIAVIEGSVSTPENLARIKAIRERSKILIAIGACATAGGIQALRNFADEEEWRSQVYPHPEYLQTLKTSTALSEHVKVDFELHGCPVNSAQLLSVMRSLLFGVAPHIDQEKVCMECKRMHVVCRMVTQGVPCMGGVTANGCGALCPGYGRACYACFGPAEADNVAALKQRFTALGLSQDENERRFRFIENQGWNSD